jgi:hypothetical protein
MSSFKDPFLVNLMNLSTPGWSSLSNPPTPSSGQSISSSQFPAFSSQYGLPNYTPEQLLHQQQLYQQLQRDHMLNQQFQNLQQNPLPLPPLTAETSPPPPETEKFKREGKGMSKPRKDLKHKTQKQPKLYLKSNPKVYPNPNEPDTLTCTPRWYRRKKCY